MDFTSTRMGYLPRVGDHISFGFMQKLRGTPYTGLFPVLGSERVIERYPSLHP